MMSSTCVKVDPRIPTSDKIATPTMPIARVTSTRENPRRADVELGVEII
jgi:hypothetical protein